MAEIRRVFDENFGVYGARKVWRQLQREGIEVARCTVARLMRQMGLAVSSAASRSRTTISRQGGAVPAGPGRTGSSPRRGPNRLWVADFTYVATWRASSMWRSSSTRSPAGSSAGGCHARPMRPCPGRPGAGAARRAGQRKAGWCITRDSGSQYLSIRYTERLGRGRHRPSVGSRRRQLRQRPGRDRHRALQDRAHPPARTLEIALKPSNSPPWNGSTGSTIGACSSPSETSHRPRPNNAIMTP